MRWSTTQLVLVSSSDVLLAKQRVHFFTNEEDRPVSPGRWDVLAGNTTSWPAIERSKFLFLRRWRSLQCFEMEIVADLQCFETKKPNPVNATREVNKWCPYLLILLCSGRLVVGIERVRDNTRKGCYEGTPPKRHPVNMITPVISNSSIPFDNIRQQFPPTA